MIPAWGLWNEPESRWNGSIESFVNVMMEYGARAIREADPNALVCGPDTGKPDTLREIMNRGGGDLRLYSIALRTPLKIASPRPILIRV